MACRLTLQGQAGTCMHMRLHAHNCLSSATDCTSPSTSATTFRIWIAGTTQTLSADAGVPLPLLLLWPTWLYLSSSLRLCVSQGGHIFSAGLHSSRMLTCMICMHTLWWKVPLHCWVWCAAGKSPRHTANPVSSLHDCSPYCGQHRYRCNPVERCGSMMCSVRVPTPVAVQRA